MEAKVLAEEVMVQVAVVMVQVAVVMELVMVLKALGAALRALVVVLMEIPVARMAWEVEGKEKEVVTLAWAEVNWAEIMALGERVMDSGMEEVAEVERAVMAGRSDPDLHPPSQSRSCGQKGRIAPSGRRQTSGTQLSPPPQTLPLPHATHPQALWGWS